MLRPRTVSAVALATVALVAAGCAGGDDGPASEGSSSTTRRSSTSSAPPSSTTTRPPDINAVDIGLTEIASGLERPTTLGARTGDDTLYVAEKPGRLRAIRGGRLDEAPVLDISGMVNDGGNEQGFLGFAYSPDGTKLYVHYSDGGGDTQIDEYAVAADGAVDPASRRAVLSQSQPQGNHNGGELAFGPDGLLYIGLGDGGAAGDQGSGHVSGGNGQSLGTLLGKILRIDPTPSGGQPYTVPADNPFVGRAGARPEIWAYGLRNPWRFSFDKDTGDLWIGDVGQNMWEEVDVATQASGNGKGANYGWNVWEGTHRFRDGDAPGAVPPVYEYSHEGGNCSVTGGHVYRGRKIPALRGVYLFADYCVGDLRGVVLQDGRVAQERILPVSGGSVSGFGEDNDGELYVVSDQGEIYSVDPA
jgi:glucose/arabinose dehydrogenase